MGRLIDADNLQFNGRNYNKSQMKAILDFIDAQPTAYDQNKVVEQLEEYLFEKYCVEGDAEIARIVKAGGSDGN